MIRIRAFGLIFLVLLIVGLWSCKEIFESSIAKKEVHLLAPGDNFNSTKYEVNFWFEPVEDALNYRLQVVSPSFESIGSVALDTLVKSNKFTYTLDPGNYQWRVRAENGSSHTPFSSHRSFTVSLSSLEQQKVSLISPSNHLLTNNTNVNFKWAALFGATAYRLQVDTNSFMNENNLLVNRLSPALEALVSLPEDNVYQWRVRAENDSSQSLWSSIYQITCDHTPPAKVVLTSPAKEEVVSLPVSLRWNAIASIKKYKLYVFKNDSTTLYDQKFPMILNTSTYSFNQGSVNEKIYWKVSAIDDAGNEGESSELRNFLLQ